MDEATRADQQTIEKSFNIFKPGGDPEVLRECAQQWRSMKACLQQTFSHLDGQVDQLREAWQGAAADKYQERYKQLKEAALKDLDQFDQIANQLEQCANEIEKVNDEIQKILAEIGISIAIGVGLSVITAGFGSAAAAAAASAQVARGATIVARLGQLLLRLAQWFRGLSGFTRFAIRTGFEFAGNMGATFVAKSLTGQQVKGEDWASGAVGALAASGLGTAVGASQRLSKLTGAGAVLRDGMTGFTAGAIGTGAFETGKGVVTGEGVDAGEVLTKSLISGAGQGIAGSASHGLNWLGTKGGDALMKRAFGLDLDAPAVSTPASSGDGDGLDLPTSTAGGGSSQGSVLDLPTVRTGQPDAGPSPTPDGPSATQDGPSTRADAPVRTGSVDAPAPQGGLSRGSDTAPAADTSARSTPDANSVPTQPAEAPPQTADAPPAQSGEPSGGDTPATQGNGTPTQGDDAPPAQRTPDTPAQDATPAQANDTPAQDGDASAQHNDASASQSTQTQPAQGDEAPFQSVDGSGRQNGGGSGQGDQTLNQDGDSSSGDGSGEQQQETWRDRISQENQDNLDTYDNEIRGPVYGLPNAVGWQGAAAIYDEEFVTGDNAEDHRKDIDAAAKNLEETAREIRNR
ncbi:hypothetical protein C3Y87_07020 [Carbonactinospora thermoautotrophica]|uniref:WXG100 family type VII secretion target n=1 Tax=Carbonactinospora thermoautotrophica TaxID=1469144 RepID=UPI00226F1CAD|nr:WXG100 family type VII secretion target [Carbonactinospora thermoautotrophica]MCX9191164.1 hypothetical protein [Carbonactinospora thermoautotrophica]